MPGQDPPEQAGAEEHHADDSFERLAAKTGISARTLKTFAAISDPKDAQRFSTEAAIKAFGKPRPRNTQTED